MSRTYFDENFPEMSEHEKMLGIFQKILSSDLREKIEAKHLNGKSFKDARDCYVEMRNIGSGLFFYKFSEKKECLKKYGFSSLLEIILAAKKVDKDFGLFYRGKNWHSWTIEVTLINATRHFLLEGESMEKAARKIKRLIAPEGYFFEYSRSALSVEKDCIELLKKLFLPKKSYKYLIGKAVLSNGGSYGEILKEAFLLEKPYREKELANLVGEDYSSIFKIAEELDPSISMGQVIAWAYSEYAYNVNSEY